MDQASRRLLAVHAHPDDESITTGATMAYYVSSGAHVTLLTCTLGEEGEVLVPELSLLAAAMAHLGVTDHRYLGAPGRFRDSGMMDTPSNTKPRAFWRAAEDHVVFGEAVAAAVAVI